MPGTKWKRSLKAPGTYKRMTRKGMSKTRAAKLSNWMASKGYKVRRTIKSAPRRVTRKRRK